MGRGKDSGKVQINGHSTQLFHASAGKDDKATTLFFTKEGKNQRIVAIGKHKTNNTYSIHWKDDRYKYNTRSGTDQTYSKTWAL